MIQEYILKGVGIVVLILSAACFVTFLDVAWEKMFGRGR